MSSAIASTSRAVMLRRCTQMTLRMSSRSFSSSPNRTETQKVSINVANLKATIELPNLTLPRWITGWIDNGNNESEMQLAVEGIANEQASDEDSANEITEWNGIMWNSVPKQRTSHRKKRLRETSKGLKDRVDLTFCAGCGQPKLSHHICSYCYARAKRQNQNDVELVRKQLAEEGLESLSMDEPSRFSKKKNKKSSIEISEQELTKSSL